MTIPNEKLIAGPYAGDGSNRAWAFDFPVLTKDEMTLIVSDALGADAAVDSSLWSIEGLGELDGGQVVYPLSEGAVPEGASVTLVREPPFTQQTSLTNQRSFYPEVCEKALDRLTMQTLWLRERLNRTVRVPLTYGPLKELRGDRAGMFLAFDNHGDPIASPGPMTGVPVSSFMAGLLGAGSGTEFLSDIVYTPPSSAIPTTLWNKLTELESVADFGARPSSDASYNSAPYFQAAFDSVPIGGAATFLIPPGDYYFASGLTFANKSITLVGLDRESTRLTFAASVAVGISGTFNQDNTNLGTTAPYYAAFRNLTICTLNQPTGKSTGTSAIGVSLDGSARTVGGYPLPSADFENVTFIGKSAWDHGWGTAIKVLSLNNICYSNCLFQGRLLYTYGTGTLITGHSVEHRFTNCTFNHLNNGIVHNDQGSTDATDGGSEGLYVCNSVMLTVSQGVVKNNNQSGVSQPLVAITNTHINAATYCVALTNCHNVLLHGNLFYIQAGQFETISTGACGVVSFTSGTVASYGQGNSIVGNAFELVGTPAAGHYGVNLGTSMNNTIIGLNCFTNFYNGVGNSATGTLLVGNVYKTVTNQINHFSGSLYKVARVAVSTGTSTE